MQERYTHSSSPVHALDARVKVILTLVFLLSLNLTPISAWPAYILYLSLTLSVALLARVGTGFVIKRSALALPFMLAALPLVFTGADARPLALPLLRELGWSVPVSLQGLERFASIALRSWISVQAAILLAGTTRFNDLLTALQQIGLPHLFVAIIGLMWRYLSVIGEEVLRMLRARASRSASAPGRYRAGGSLAWRARVTGGMAGSLFLRSLERSDRVYSAMLSRGYNGQQPVEGLEPISAANRRILLAGVALLAALWLFGLLTGR